MTAHSWRILALLSATPLLQMQAEEQKAVFVEMNDHIYRPAVAEASPERVASLKVPAGFKVTKVAGGLKEPRMLAVAPNGDLYVTRRGPFSDVLLLKAKDGGYEAPREIASLPDVHGIALRDGKVYLAAVRKLYVADILPDGSFSEPKVLYDDLPDAGQHPNRTLAFSPKGELFLSVGSTCNEAPEANKESATMLKVGTDGGGRTVFAEGLRNTIGFDWDPSTGRLWGMDHGIDWLGDDAQGEELNEITEGANYGWPFVYENGKPNMNRNPKPVVGKTWEQYAQMCKSPALTYAAHSAPMQFRFYNGKQFPEHYRHGAFLTLHGSWNRADPKGYEVVWVPFKDGEPQAFESFLSGFLSSDGKSQFGRPCGLAIDHDGSLLVGDDQNGAIYRVAFTGSEDSNTCKSHLNFPGVSAPEMMSTSELTVWKIQKFSPL